MNKLLITVLCLASFVAAQTAAAPRPSSTPPPRRATQNPNQPTAHIETTVGNIHCVLFPDKAPISVANFIGLATGTKPWKNPKTGQMVKGVPLYNGTIFHRVIPSFMIQGGDPQGTGGGDPGFQIKDETSPSLKFDQPGRLAYANAGPNTNGSQFFITEAPVDLAGRPLQHLRPVPGPRCGEEDRPHAAQKQRPSLQSSQDH